MPKDVDHDARREELLEALIERVKGPDFPTGAQILGIKGIQDAYRTGRGSITMRAVVTVEDDGAGVDPRQLEDLLAGRRPSASVGLRNVDARLRATFGMDHGLTIETGIGAGTKVTMRLPKSYAELSAQ